MDINFSTNQYESWIQTHTEMDTDLLNLKHKRMKQSVFNFFRGSYYHWAQLWAEAEKNFTSFPRVLSVADIHYENFGTWRDGEARLVWGVNDFDEAFELPFIHDIIRLACSVTLGVEEGHIQVRKSIALQSIINGYKQALVNGTQPFVLEEQHTWLRKLASNKLRNPKKFWASIVQNEPTHPPADIRKILHHHFPDPDATIHFYKRVAGLGSLGRPRYIAVAAYNGGYICREAKKMVPSACAWVYNKSVTTHFYHELIQRKAIRSNALFLSFTDGWQIKKLSPDHSRIELDDFPKHRREEKLLFAMGFELANIHAFDNQMAQRLLSSLETIPIDWIKEITTSFSSQMKKDYKHFCRFS